MPNEQENQSIWLINPSYFLREGLKMCRVNEDTQRWRSSDRNVEVFKSHFGRHPLHLSRVWRDLQKHEIMTVHEAKQKRSFVGFLLANNFLRCYETANVRSARFDICLDDLRELTTTFVDKIIKLKLHKVKCPTEWDVNMFASVDGTHVPEHEPRDPTLRRNPKNFSYKNNFAGLNFQIVLALWSNQVLYANAGDPASMHDMTAIRAEFVNMVPEGGRVIADAGYIGKTEREKKIFAVKNNLDSEEVGRFKGRARARQESFNKRMKDYVCLTTKFRHGSDFHRKCFLAVLILCQYAIEDTSSVGEPLDTL
jgi:Transposase DDE domain